MIWLLFAGVAFVALAPRRSRPSRVTVGDPIAPSGWTTGERQQAMNASWKCGRAGKLPLPQVSSIVPAGIVGGPIVVAIDAMIGVVKSVFAAIGLKAACTVVGGRVLDLAVMPERVSVVVRVTVGWAGRDPAASITFRADDVSSTGFVPPIEITDAPWRTGIIQWLYPPGERPEGYYADDPHYLIEGGAPSVVWPHHPGGQRWAASVTEDLDQPRVDVVRHGANLRLHVWLPPRSGRWRQNKAGQRVYDRDARWTIEWAYREAA